MSGINYNYIECTNTYRRFLPTVVTMVTTEVEMSARASPARAALYNLLATNNWNNQNLYDLVSTLVKAGITNLSQGTVSNFVTGCEMACKDMVRGFLSVKLLDGSITNDNTVSVQELQQLAAPYLTFKGQQMFNQQYPQSVQRRVNPPYPNHLSGGHNVPPSAYGMTNIPPMGSIPPTGPNNNTNTPAQTPEVNLVTTTTTTGNDMEHRTPQPGSEYVPLIVQGYTLNKVAVGTQGYIWQITKDDDMNVDDHDTSAQINLRPIGKKPSGTVPPNGKKKVVIVPRDYDINIMSINEITNIAVILALDSSGTEDGNRVVMNKHSLVTEHLESSAREEISACTNLNQVAEILSNYDDDLYAAYTKRLNISLTNVLNWMLKYVIELDISVDSFMDDWPELINFISSNINVQYVPFVQEWETAAMARVMHASAVEDVSEITDQVSDLITENHDDVKLNTICEKTLVTYVKFGSSKFKMINLPAAGAGRMVYSHIEEDLYEICRSTFDDDRADAGYRHILVTTDGVCYEMYKGLKGSNVFIINVLDY